MNSSQIKWLLIGLAGSAFCTIFVVGGVFFLAMSTIDSDERGGSWLDSGTTETIDAPAEWRRQAEQDRAARRDPEYQRLLGLYELTAPYVEVRRRLFFDRDYEFAESELKRQFDAIDDPIAALSYATTIDQLSDFSYELEPGDLRSIMETWTEEYPDSHFAWLVRGKQAIDYAWYWRGSGYASTVSDEAWEQFYVAIAEANDCLSRAYGLEPRDPEIATAMLTICKAQSLPRDEMEKWFERAVAVVPSHYSAHTGKFDYLRPAWSGSWPEYTEFYDEVEAAIAARGNDPVLRMVKREAMDTLESDWENYSDGLSDADRRKQRDLDWLKINADLVARAPGDVRLRGKYLYWLKRNNRHREAHAQLVELGNRYPMGCGWNLQTYHQRRLESYFLLATQRSTPNPMSLCEEMLAIDSESYVPYQCLAYVYDKNNDSQAAEDAILNAVSFARNHGGPYMQLSGFYEKQGRYEEALEAVRTALARELPEESRAIAEKREADLRRRVTGSSPSPN